MPQAALNIFNADLARSSALVAHADRLPAGTDAEKLLRSDALRAGWMFAVGAMDAYFCDAYTDLVAATLICKNRQGAVQLPDFVLKIQLPIAAILEPYPNRQNWRWRMAARRMMVKQNALRLRTTREWFNPYCRKGHKLFGEVIVAWASDPDSTARVFGITRTAFSALQGPARHDAKINAQEAIERRIEGIIERRHDCIHNCDRPGNVPQRLDRAGTVSNVIRDIRFFVEHCDAHIQSEFSHWLRASVGFSPAVAAQIGY